MGQGSFSTNLKRRRQQKPQSLASKKIENVDEEDESKSRNLW